MALTRAGASAAVATHAVGAAVGTRETKRAVVVRQTLAAIGTCKLLQQSIIDRKQSVVALTSVAFVTSAFAVTRRAVVAVSRNAFARLARPTVGRRTEFALLAVRRQSYTLAIAQFVAAGALVALRAAPALFADARAIAKQSVFAFT